MTLDEIIDAIKRHPAADDLRLELHELEIHRDTLWRLYKTRDGIGIDEAQSYLHSVLEPHPDD